VVTTKGEQRGTEQAPATGPRETVYDAEIFPLMARVIEIAKRAGIPMVAQFQLDDHKPGDPIYCTTALTDEASDHLRGVAARMYPSPSVMAFTETTTTAADGSKSIAIRRVL
jgi:hypothetical protein